MADTLQDLLAQLDEQEKLAAQRQTSQDTQGEEAVVDQMPQQQVPTMQPQLNYPQQGVNPEATLGMLIAQQQQGRDQRFDPRIGGVANIIGALQENHARRVLSDFGPQVAQLKAKKFEAEQKKTQLALDAEQYKTEQEKAQAEDLGMQLQKKREAEALTRVTQAYFKRQPAAPTDIQTAGVVQKPDGSYLTHAEVLKARQPDLDIQDLMLNNISLGNYLNRPYSPVEADEVQKRIDQEQRDQAALDTAIRKGTKGQTPEQRFLTLSKMSNAVANQMHNIAVGLGNFTLTKGDADFAMKAMVIPMIKNIADYQRSFGVTPTVDPRGVAEAYMSGDTTKLGEQIKNLGAGMVQSGIEANKPLTSPGKVKDVKKPIVPAQSVVEPKPKKNVAQGAFVIGKIYKMKNGARLKYKGGDPKKQESFEVLK